MSMQGLQRAQQLLNVIGQQFPSIAQDANKQFDATVAALKQSLADCEKGRRTDSDAMDAAKKAYAAQIDAFRASDAKVRTQTQQSLSTTCLEIASQPTCVTAAP